MKGCRPLTTQEIISVSEQFTEPYKVRNRALFILGISTGGRIAELLSLKIEDVWQGGQAVSDLLYEKNVVKGKENSRLIPVNSDAKQVIQELVSWQKEQYGSIEKKRPLFPSRKGFSAISTTQGYRVLKDAFSLAGLNGKVATHSMRKTYAQRLYDATGDIYLVAEALGHKAVETTKKYLGVSYDKLRRASEEIELCNRTRISLHSIDDISTGELIVELMSRGVDMTSAIEQRKASAVRALRSPSAKRKAKIVKFPNRRV